MEALNYKLEQFEGPLDLLLDLVAKNKVDVFDIPISLICDQYLDYIAEAERLDMELASEFLTMASYLILIKSKMLLPKKEKEQEDPREDLSFIITEHYRSRMLALALRERYSQFGGRWQKDTDEISPDRTFVLDHEPARLYEAARRVLAYQRTERAEPIEKITLVGLCTDICVLSNALLVKAHLPEIEVVVDAACCAGVTPESHNTALAAMKMCQIVVENE